MTRTSVRVRRECKRKKRRIGLVVTMLTLFQLLAVPVLTRCPQMLTTAGLLLKHQQLKYKVDQQMFRYDPADRVTDLEEALGRYTDGECLNAFRFTKQDIRKLYMHLDLIDEDKGDIRLAMGNRGFRLFKSELLLVKLAYLAYPTRLSTMMGPFGLSEPQLSKCINYTCDRLKEKYEVLFTSPRMWRPFFADWAKAVHDFCGPTSMTNVWGFIDGTVRAICRPKCNYKIWGKPVDIQK